MEAHTQGLARACVEMELVGELSSARLRDELEALLSEEEVAGTLRRLGELHLDQAIHPHLAPARTRSSSSPSWTAACAARAETRRVAAPARRAGAPPAAGRALRLVRAAAPAPPRRRPDRRRRHGGPAAARARRGHGRARRAPRARGAARSRRRPHGNGRRRRGGALGLERYFEELRDVRLEISGADLAELGLGESPQVGVVLDEVLRRKLNGELAGARPSWPRRVSWSARDRRDPRLAAAVPARQPRPARARARLGGHLARRPVAARGRAAHLEPDPASTRSARRCS